LVYPNGINDNQKFLEKALDRNLTGVSETIFSSIQPAINLLNIQTEDPKIKEDTKNIINFLMNKVEEEVKRVPESSRTLYIAGAIYAKNNDFIKAEELLTRAVEISPNRQIYLTMLANIKSILKKDTEQTELLKRAYEAEKSNEKAWVDYISNLQKTNKEEFLKEIEIAQKENKINLLISFFDQQIENKPDSPQLYINKVVILAQVGMFKEAIVELEKIENKFPEIKSQTKTWKALFEKGQLPK
jgi:tetratricopeptide (TPR) repeat protein